MRVTTTDVKARKRHTCSVCSWPIEPGDTYVRTATFDYGTVSVWKCHVTPCDQAAGQAYLDGYDDDGLIDADAVAEWAEEHQDIDESAADLVRRLEINRVRQLAIREGNRNA